ncbi:uncharacterized protein LOC114267517 [Camellia sinensis]|uniref:uncharacterized protein LOC114267517 n=1 Tax=Camellia sinensis TaxID=4442 RepID=UPI001035AF5C|nr:uncharacterized protein LOC114267517 [Camellia sinensis]
MVETYRDWPEKLPFALWGYKTSIRTSTGATSYSLVYGMEAVLPIEIEVPSLRIMVEFLTYHFMHCAGCSEEYVAYQRVLELQKIAKTEVVEVEAKDAEIKALKASLAKLSAEKEKLAE